MDGTHRNAGRGGGLWRFAILAGFALLGMCLSSCASNSGSGEKPDSFSGASTQARNGNPILDEIPAAEGAGRTLIAFFTGGNISETVAEDLQAIYSADVERIVEKKRRRGFFGYMGAGADATFHVATRIAEPLRDPAAYDTVIVITPVWSWNLSPPVRSWLRWAKGRLPKVAFVVVSGGTEPDKIAADMAKEGGGKPSAVLGFNGTDFDPEGRTVYVEKVRAFSAALAGGSAR